MAQSFSGSVNKPPPHISRNQPSTPSRTHGGVRRLTERELEEKKAKGLCFRCDGRWGIGHVCAARGLSVLLVEGEEETEVDGGLAALETPEEEEEIPATISINSIVGLTNPKTMKLVGKIGDEEVVVMVDPGSTHNFLSLRTVEKLRIPIMGPSAFGVSLGNGESVKGRGLCKGVRLRLNSEVELVEDFLPLQLGNSDVILGIQWLEKLGTILTNWKTQEMSFKSGGRTVTVKGDPSLARTGITLKAMVRTLRKEKKGVLLELCELGEGEDILVEGEEEEGKAEDSPAFLRKVLAEFAGVFEAPQGLPPSRDMNMQ